ncbi:MAG: acyl-CoA dehydratase activase-related protein [Firmicutes bacterium]|nr:acyl-CoA dehydratase activase-related protein [Bacillota bacterium]
MKRIGIPRGLYYYKYYPFAKIFLTELGAEVVLSPETNKEILDIGSKYCIDDACLPVKVYHGHVYFLKDKVDYVLIPRFTSISAKEYICPKFGGLPEMVRYSIPMNSPIIDIEINLYKNKFNLYKSLFSLGNMLGANPIQIKKAINKAFKTHYVYKKDLLNGNLPAVLIENKKPVKIKTKSIVGIVSHPYLLYDSFINMNLLKKLSGRCIKYITPEMIDSQIIDNLCNELEKRIFWSSSKELIGSALYMMNINRIEGILLLTSFACGIDSLSLELIIRIANKIYNKPIMMLTLDEHTGEANFNTRLEAFMDLVERRQNLDNNLSPYGRGIYCSERNIR